MMPTNNFFATSRFFGSSSLFVQGGGGNVSEKQGEMMYVKASGVFLRDVATGTGYAACNYPAIQKHLLRVSSRIPLRSHMHEKKFNEVIQKSIVQKDSFGVPSIETGMHAMLSTHAIHTHNVYASVLLCMEGGLSILASLFRRERALVLPYVSPGFYLARAIAGKTKRREEGLPSIIFLENHGVITHHKDSRRANNLMRFVSTKIENYLRSHGVFTVFAAKEGSVDFPKHLFPDSVVYALIDHKALAPDKKQTFYEIGSTTNYILETIARLGGTPRYLEPKDVAFIRGMEKEKYRAQMVRMN